MYKEFGINEELEEKAKQSEKETKEKSREAHHGRHCSPCGHQVSHGH